MARNSSLKLIQMRLLRRSNLLLEHKCNVPAGEQRLVYKGRVLYDDDRETLKTYGLESDHTVHLVRGSGGLSWIERTPSQVFGPRMHFIQAMHDSNPEFRQIMQDPEFKRMFLKQPMSMEQWMTLNETVFSELTKGPVPPEELYATQLAQLQEMGFSDTSENLQALIAHSGDVYGTIDLLTILSKFH
ncbi:uncharacterized protein [Rutidosis leptorrhynchoides]|uniref:uncharacterized protein n=1 Tax=Rutidosis leptorrhynchoides TaxID=125765 RepID=UPI003A992EAB